MDEPGLLPPQRTGRTKDARGRRVTQLDPAVMYLLRRHDVIPADVLSRLAKEIGIGWSRFGRVLFFIAVADLCIFLIANTVEFYRLVVVGTAGFWGFLKEMAPMTPVWVCPVLFWLLVRKARSTRIAPVMLEYLRCPHCGYDIRGLPTDPEDGATICPECGCAWRLDSNARSD